MTFSKDFRQGSGVMAGARAGRRRRAIALALTAFTAVSVAPHVSAAPPASHTLVPLHAASDAEAVYLAGHPGPSSSPAVAGGHATHDPLWAGYPAAPHHHASSGCASCKCAAEGKKHPSRFRQALGSVTSGFDRLIFGSKNHHGCECNAAGGDLPCDAIGPDNVVPLRGYRQPFTAPLPGGAQLAPMPRRAPSPVPVPRREPAPAASDPQSDPFADDQVSLGSNPAVARSGYYD